MPDGGETMIKNFVPYIEKMPIKKRRVPLGAWSLEILCWSVVVIATLYFAPIVWNIFTR
jgi:hypothetical protein